MNRLITLYQLRGVSLTALVIAVLGLVLSVEVAASQTSQPATDLAAFILVETGISVTEASVESGEARIAYQQAHGAAPDMLAVDWLLLMQAATAFAPDVERVAIEVWTHGVTQLEVVAQASDIAAVSSGSLDPESFFSLLTVTDRRPPAVALAQELSLSGGWEALDVAIAGEEVTISFFQPPVPDATVLMSGWYDILAAAVEYVPGATRITLLAQLADGSTTTTSVAAADVRAYLAGEIEPTEMLLALDMVTGVAPSGPEAAGATQAGPAEAAMPEAEPEGVGATADEGSGLGTAVLLSAAALCLAGLAAVAVLAIILLRRRKAPPAPVVTRATAPMDAGICPHCGSQVTPGKRFCSDCGGALAGNLPPPPR